MHAISTRTSKSRERTIAYWISTSILSAECIIGGTMGAMHLQPFFGIVHHLGYRVRSQYSLKVRAHDFLDAIDLGEFCQSCPVRLSCAFAVGAQCLNGNV
jgi:hypothetical protein